MFTHYMYRNGTIHPQKKVNLLPYDKIGSIKNLLF
jgi:hypothetical protein